MTNNEYRIGSSTKTVANILLQGRFQVPWHQREFDWEPDDVEQFWDDIVEAVNKQHDDYFVGSIVLTKSGEGNYHIQDGQQRLVTYSLMCAALSRAFEKEHDANTDARIQVANKILFDISPTTMNNMDEVKNSSPRINPSLKDRLNYGLIIRGRHLEPNGKLKKAWHILHNRSLDLSEGDADRMLRYLTKSVVAVEITTGEQNATQVFETLNDRGKRLEDVDLLRNHLYSYFGTDSDERHRRVHDDLVALRDQFDGPYAVNKMSEYVRCTMQCRFGFINAKRLNKGTIQAITKDIEGFDNEAKKDYIADLAFELRKSEHIQAFLVLDKADMYSELVKDFVSKAGTEYDKRNMRDFITEMRDYKVTRPIFFAILMQFQRAQGGEKRSKARYGHALAQNITAFMMRTAAATDKFSPATVEGTLSNWGRQIAEVLGKETVADFAAALKNIDKSRIWSDKDFRDALLNLRLESPKAKKILYPLYKFEQSDLSQQNQEHMTVEHIVPRSPKWLIGWEEFGEDTHASYSTRLGNLTLMSRSDNKSEEEHNESFEAKKALLRVSALKENQRLAECEIWGPQAITAREGTLIDLACQVWCLREK